MTGTFVAFIVLVFFLVLLALGEADTWSSKIDALSRRHDRSNWHEAAALVATSLRRFLLVRALTGALSVVLYVGWLWLFGIDLLLVWAILTFILTFIPNIGSIISGLLPVLYAFLTADLGTAFAVGAGILAIEQVIGNFIDPKLQGRQILLSPFVILIALLFWGWLWGLAGAFLAVPMTSTILVVCAYVPALRPVALLLSNQRNEEELDEALAD
jgi:AI-2 transport protein TqsA